MNSTQHNRDFCGLVRVQVPPDNLDRLPDADGLTVAVGPVLIDRNGLRRQLDQPVHTQFSG